LIFNESP